jgi:DNA-binding transcriptional LysR family regulator
MMEWQQLIGFYHVSKSGSLAKAAATTFRTPSALSQQIAALERELGCLLFDRVGGKKMSITPAGRRLLEFTLNLFEEHKKLENEISQIGGLYSGRLKIAAPFSFLYYWLSKIIREYSDHFTHIELTTLERSAAECVDLARTGEVDMAFAVDEMVPKDLVTLKIMKISSFIVAPVGHPLTGITPITLRDIAKYPLILPPAKMNHRRPHLEQLLDESGIPFRKTMEASNFLLASRYVELGLGICPCVSGLVPETFFDKKFEMIPLDHIMGTDHTVIVLRKDKIIEPHQTAFISQVLLTLADRTCVQSSLKELALREMLTSQSSFSQRSDYGEKL